MLGLIYSKIVTRLSLSLSTLWSMVKYWPHISLSGHCWLQKGVLFKPYYSEKGKLQLVLNGYNLIGHNSVFQGSSVIEFGERSYCAGSCVFASNARIQIGKDVMIADYVTIRDTDHCIADLDRPMMSQGIVSKAVIVEDDVWIAHGAVILKGVTLGRGSVVAAGSIVTKDVPPYAVVAGTPAKVIRYRKNEEGQHIV